MRAIIFILIVFSSFPCRAATPVQVSEGYYNYYIKIRFKSSGGLVLNYTDSSYKHATISFQSKGRSDTAIIKKISTKRPTVFSYVQMDKGDLFEYPYLAVADKDTISIVFNAGKLCIDSTDRKSLIMEKSFFGKRPLIDRNYISVSSYKIRRAQLLSEKEEKLVLLNRLLIDKSIDSSSLPALKNYIELRYYTSLFNMDSAAAADQQLLEYLHSDFAEVKTRTDIFNNIACGEIHALISHMLRYRSHGQYDLLKQVETIDSSLMKTDYLNAYIFYSLDRMMLPLKKRNDLMQALEPYMLPEERPALKTLKIDPAVLSSSFLNIKGDKISFHDIIQTEKKLILIDLWASWCEPCIYEMTFLKTWEKDFSDQLKVISISIDSDQKAWKKACEKQGVMENSYLIKDKKLVEYFKVSRIPRYLLLNNKGELIADEFYRPSNGKFGGELSAVLRDIEVQ